MALKNKYNVTLDGQHLGNIDANDETHAERLAQQKWPNHPSDDLLEVSKRPLKSPIELANSFINGTSRWSNSPLDEFQNYEAANFYGAYNDARKYFGIKEPNNITYPQLLDAYKKSKGKYARTIDPSVQKYFNDQLAKRQAILDRFKKIPSEQSEEFQRGLGWELDPFDFDEDSFVPEDLANGSVIIDYDPYSWETIEKYLTKKGY